MEWLLAGGALLNFLGGQGARSQASEASRIGSEQAALQRELYDYIIGRRRRVFDPIEEQTVLPGLQRRATQTPFYARDWLKQARGLREPMQLNY